MVVVRSQEAPGE
jgi:hypothetical protein